MNNTGININSKMSMLNVVSYNIDGLKRESTLTSILHAACENGPDVICLTNTTIEALEYIQDTLADRYVEFQVFAEEGEESGTVILCNKKTAAISQEETPYYFDYPTARGRIIGTGIVHLNSKTTFNVLTADVDHQHIKRLEQLDTLSKVLKDMKDYIITGDVGSLNPDIIQAKDAWAKMGCPLRCRSDITRTYYDSHILIPKSMSLIGTKIKGAEHLGVETVFLVKKGRV